MAINRTKRQRKRELKALLLRLLTILLLGVILLASIYLYEYLTTTDKLTIKNIRVTGVNRTDAVEIERMLADLKGQNILQAPLKDCKQRLKMMPRVKEANLKMVLPFTIACTITEREPIALVFTNRFMEVDEEGMVFKEDALTSNLDLPIITGLVGNTIAEGQICAERGLQDALRTLALCKSFGGNFAEEISEIKVGPGGISIISLREGCIVILGDSHFEKRLKKFFLLKDTIKRNEAATRLIDLRFDDQIVLRSAF